MATKYPGGYIIVDTRDKITNTGIVTQEVADSINAAFENNIPILYVGPVTNNTSAFNLDTQVCAFLPISNYRIGGKRVLNLPDANGGYRYTTTYWATWDPATKTLGPLGT